MTGKQTVVNSVIKVAIPQALNEVKKQAQQSIIPIKPVNDKTDKDLLFAAKLAEASCDLPPYYLVYFLLVDLLDFNNLGRSEKIAWSVPIDFYGSVYLIEYRKLSFGVFGRGGDREEQNAQHIVALINRGVKVAKPFFKWMADDAVNNSKLNVINKAYILFERYQYLRDLYNFISTEKIELNKKKMALKNKKDSNFDGLLKEHAKAYNLSTDLSKKAGWLAMSAIDAFFSWTEHIFIHLAILQGHITTGNNVTTFMQEKWADKFKHVLNISNPNMKTHFDILVTIKRQLRNFMAHGAFGKDGQAFYFHSNTGAVPVALDYTKNKPRFSITPELGFDDTEAIKAIEKFISYMWSELKPAEIYIQKSYLPLILPMANDGTYKKAMSSLNDMIEFVDRLGHEFDITANMDW